MQIKHKKWIDSVERLRNVNSRRGFLRLDKNERVHPFSHSFWEKVIDKISQEHVQAYPETERLYFLLGKLNSRDISEFIITPGSDAAIRTAFDLCVNPDDAVIILQPTFAMVEVYCELYNAEKRIIQYNQNLYIDIGHILDAIDENVSLIVIANPDSPTGTVISVSNMERIVSKAQTYGIVVLIDEAYYEFCGETMVGLIDTYPNVMITRTMSKAYGIAGLRIGYIMAQTSLASLLYRYRPLYEVNSIALIFAEAFLENWSEVRDYLVKVEEGRKYLINELIKLNMEYVDTKTNFIHVNFGPNKANAGRLFKQNGIIVRDGLKMESFKDYWRITLGSKTAMEKLISAMRDL